MEKENIKELVDMFMKANYMDLFGAIIVYELDLVEDLEDLSDEDIEKLENIYAKYMNSKTISGLLNDELKEIIDKESE